MKGFMGAMVIDIMISSCIVFHVMTFSTANADGLGPGSPRGPHGGFCLLKNRIFS